MQVCNNEDVLCAMQQPLPPIRVYSTATVPFRADPVDCPQTLADLVSIDSHNSSFAFLFRSHFVLRSVRNSKFVSRILK